MSATTETVATTRDQAMEYADTLKFALASNMKLGVPAICLACQNSGPIPNVCKEGQDVTGAISRAEGQSAFDALLLDICPYFLSNVKHPPTSS